MKRIIHLLGLAALLASFAFATPIDYAVIDGGKAVVFNRSGFGLSSTDFWQNDDPFVLVRAFDSSQAPLTVTSTPSGSVSQPGKAKSLEGLVGFGAASVSFDVTMNSDPEITYSQTFSNATNGDLSFEIEFITPVDPGNYGSTLASLGVTLTRTSSNASATASNIQTLNYLGTGGPPVYSLDITNPLPAGTISVSQPALSNTVTFPSSGFILNTFSPRSDITAMRTVVRLTLSGSGTNSSSTANKATLSGSYVLLPATVPEPGTFAMLGLGLLGLAFAARRRVN